MDDIVGVTLHELEVVLETRSEVVIKLVEERGEEE
jgi:hypothetical protein